MFIAHPAPTRKRKKTPLQFTATCATGLEELVSEEISQFNGLEIEIKPGAVRWKGGLDSGYRACLWSRFASRILLELARFDAPDPDAIYHHSGEIVWDEHFTIKKTFAVHATLVQAAIGHSQYAALRVKDAIADQFRRRFGKRPDVNSFSPDIRLHLHVEATGASLSLDLSGESLHRRGYRVATGEAPLKETLAAAIVKLSGWLEHWRDEPILLDPMCGGGTLLIEAGLMLGDSAPGLQRKKFGFMAWNKHDPFLWERLVNEALEREAQAQPAQWPQLIGYDADPRAVAAARKNVIAAGLRENVIIRYRQLAQLQSPGQHGCLLSNPPYGERLSEREAVKYLYRFLGRRYRERFLGWRFGFFTANPDLSSMIGVQWQERRRLYNGPIACQLMVGVEEQQAPVRPRHQWTAQPLAPGSPGEDFGNRLCKNLAHLRDWIEREDIHCFRLYDADMPEYNLAIDCYEQWLHVQEYAPPTTVDADKAKERFQLALAVMREVLATPHSQLFIKTRQKQKGTAQYQKKPGLGTLHEVREAGCSFLVNFTDYLDTGLFLDHRPTRSHLAALASGKTFLNLYGYTGAATVHAAKGGATSTVTVDISDTYLARASANLALNGYGGPLHQCIEADCMQWLRQNEERFGLIFVDPPTFSNSRHRNENFDIQRDHPGLLRLAMQHLSRNGLLLFSTNFRSFQLDPAISEEWSVAELSEQTIPPDFQRNRRIHRVWELRHRSAPGSDQ